MIIGCPRESKNNENRVGLTQAGVHSLAAAGHSVVIERGAGENSGISDAEYMEAGATLGSVEEVFAQAEMIIKVKEPEAKEIGLLRPGQIVFAYLHLAPEKGLTGALLDRKVVAIAYETIAVGRSLPLLTPMSEVAGRMSVQLGAQFLTKPAGGKGVLLGGVPGVDSAQVVVIGGGMVGTNAAKMAAGLGAKVVVLDTSAERLAYLADIFGNQVTTIMSNSYNIAKWVRRADLLVGAVLIPGARTPRLVTEDMVKTMSPGSVIVDVAIDQGGSVETMDRVTTHSDPTFIKHGVIHYSVANMPGAVARTSTFALTNATLGYALQIANKGWKQAAIENEALGKGLNLVEGHVTYKAVADAQGREYMPWQEAAGLV